MHCFETSWMLSNTSFWIFRALSNSVNLRPNKPNHWWVDTESILNSLISDFVSNNVLLNLREYLRPPVIDFSLTVFPPNLELKSNQILTKIKSKKKITLIITKRVSDSF